MSQPITDKIIAQAVTQMRAISGLGTTIDRDSNIIPSVEDNRTNWEQDELPAISVFDGESVIQNPEAFDNTSNVLQTMRILFRGSVKQGTTAAAARNLNRDILAAIRANQTFDVANVPLVMLTRQVRHAIVRNENSFEIEGCEVEIEVLYRTQKFNAEA